MQSTKQSRAHPARKQKKEPRRSRPATLDPEKVDQVHRALSLLSESQPIPKGPVFRQTPSGTLEQVGREADNAWAGVKKIFQLLNTEGKVADSQTSGQASYNGTLVNLSAAIAQGSADNQRNGDSIKITRIRACINLSYNAAATVMTVVLGRSKDGVPAIGDIFETIGTGYSQISFENHDQRMVDVWLAHKRVVTNSVDNVGHVFTFDLDKLEVPTTYLNASTTVTSGCYWLAVIAGTTGAGSYVFNVRMNFVDN